MKNRRYWGISRSLIALSQIALMLVISARAERDGMWIMQYLAYGVIAMFVAILIFLTLPAAIKSDP